MLARATTALLLLTLTTTAFATVPADHVVHYATRVQHEQCADELPHNNDGCLRVVTANDGSCGEYICFAVPASSDWIGFSLQDLIVGRTIIDVEFFDSPSYEGRRLNQETVCLDDASEVSTPALQQDYGYDMWVRITAVPAGWTASSSFGWCEGVKGPLTQGTIAVTFHDIG